MDTSVSSLSVKIWILINYFIFDHVVSNEMIFILKKDHLPSDMK